MKNLKKEKLPIWKRMNKLTVSKWLRIVAGIEVLALIGAGIYLVSDWLNLPSVQICYAVATVSVITIVLLFGAGLRSPHLLQPDLGSNQTQAQSPERSKNNASAG